MKQAIKLEAHMIYGISRFMMAMRKNQVGFMQEHGHSLDIDANGAAEHTFANVRSTFAPSVVLLWGPPRVGKKRLATLAWQINYP